MPDKLCHRCGLEKPIDQFCKDTRAKDRLYYYCKECHAEQASIWWRKTHPDRPIFVEPAGAKRCSQCGGVKAFDHFYKHKTGRKGLGSCCKKCSDSISKRSADKNRKNNLALGFVEKQLTCCDCKQTKSSKFFYKSACYKSGFSYKCKSCTSIKERKYHYGITPDSLCEMIKRQDEKCAVCKTDLGAEFHIDHDHKTGRVRGVLCQDCNLGIGRFKDNVSILRSAISYLIQQPRK